MWNGKTTMEKKYKIPGEQIRELIKSAIGCIASDTITVGGELVGYMYRDEPEDESDSGWRFLSGLEDQEYADDPNNFAFYRINTIANYDPAILPYIDYPVGSLLVRTEGTNEFELEPSDSQE